MRSQRTVSLAFTLTLCLFTLAAVVAFMYCTADADGGMIRYVATTGVDVDGCTEPDAPCRTLQYAVDAAGDEDLIKVAGGTYTDVLGRPVSEGYDNPPARGIITQVVYIDKSVTIQGGYTTDFVDPPDPEVSPVILDAQGLGRGVVISGVVTVTVEGLVITGGDASGMGGDVFPDADAGGGVMVLSATVTISNCAVDGNVASTTARGHGAGMYFAHSTATLSGNALTNNTSSSTGSGRAGGLYLDYSAVVLSDNIIQDNTASTTTDGQGGGLFIWYSAVILNDNKIISNTASTASLGSGGGLECWHSDATLNGNTVQGNVASGASDAYRGRTDAASGLRYVAATLCGEIVIMGEGGGVYFGGSTATISNNAIISNIATTHAGGAGGGVSLSSSTATLSGNTIRDNVASTDSGAWSGGVGGGIEVYHSTATLTRNIVERNLASSVWIGYGGGLYLWESDATLEDNTVRDNLAGTTDCGMGGGLYAGNSDVMLSENAVIGNVAALSPIAAGYGGGLAIKPSSSLISINNMVAGNRANNEGGGLWFEGEVAGPTSGSLLHTTIADNRNGCGEGVHVSEYATLSFINTIISGHTTGIFADSSGAAGLEATLWHDNGTDSGGTGTITIGTVNIYGDPAFMHPDSGNYHIAEDSTAKDAGVDAGVTVDIDDQPRPYNTGYDIGADEFHPYFHLFLPLILRNAL